MKTTSFLLFALVVVSTAQGKWECWSGWTNGDKVTLIDHSYYRKENWRRVLFHIRGVYSVKGCVQENWLGKNACYICRKSTERATSCDRGYRFTTGNCEVRIESRAECGGRHEDKYNCDNNWKGTKRCVIRRKCINCTPCG